MVVPVPATGVAIFPILVPIVQANVLGILGFKVIPVFCPLQMVNANALEIVGAGFTVTVIV